jgi:hypothetical protein
LLNYFIGYEEDSQKFGDTSVTRNVAKVYVDKKSSWADAKLRTDQYLRYNQVIFDIVELFRRRAQIAFDHASSSDACEYILREHHRRLNEELQRLKQESVAGSEFEVVKTWERSITDSLAESLYILPEIRENQLSYYFSIGMGSGIITGSLTDKISPSFSLSVGFGTKYKEFLFAVWLVNQYAVAEPGYIPAESWSDKNNIESFLSTVFISYDLYKTKNMTLAPLLGLGITESSIYHNSTEGKISYVKYSPVFGFSMDYRFKTIINLTDEDFLFGQKGKNDLGVATKLFVTPMSFTPEMSGLSINLTISFMLHSFLIDVL